MPRNGIARRNEGRGQNGFSAGDSEAIVGCPVIDPITCQCPKLPIVEEEGVKMTCTYDACPFAKMPLHPECYQSLEDSLVKRLATLGSARGWTVPQRRNNLWEKKGQALIGRFCRCRCGHGQMTRDKQALYEKEKAVEKEKKKKAKKTKQLPQLQFNSKPAAAIEEKKRDQRDGSVTNGRTLSSTSRSRLFTDRSTTSTTRTIVLYDTVSQSSAAEYGHSSNHQISYEPSVSGDSIDETFELSSRVVPAPPPPPQLRSYAATIKKEQPQPTLIDSPDSGIRDVDQLELHEIGDFVDPPTHEEDSLNPLGLSILSPVGSSTLQDDVFFPPPGLTLTPRIPRSSIFSSSDEEKQMPRLPLASSSYSVSASSTTTSSRTSSTNSPLELTSLRSIASMKPTSAVSVMASTSTRSVGTQCSDSDLNMMSSVYTDGEDSMCYSRENIQDNWTPMFGRGFNLAERLLYFP